MLPIDLMEDPVPVVGYRDDLTVITELWVISVFINHETKRKAREKALEQFSNATEEDFREIDKKL